VFPIATYLDAFARPRDDARRERVGREYPHFFGRLFSTFSVQKTRLRHAALTSFARPRLSD
jgi:hypothetical protein